MLTAIATAVRNPLAQTLVETLRLVRELRASVAAYRELLLIALEELGRRERELGRLRDRYQALLDQQRSKAAEGPQ